MKRRHWMRTFFSLVIVALLAFGGAIAPASARPAADVSGNTYTSPTYGYTMTWPSNWFVIQEKTDPTFDIVTISDGVSFFGLMGAEECIGIPALCLSSAVRYYGQAPYSNMQPMNDANGNSMVTITDAKAFGTYTVTYTSDDGDVIDEVKYLEFRPLVEGKALIDINITTLPDF